MRLYRWLFCCVCCAVVFVSEVTAGNVWWTCRATFNASGYHTARVGLYYDSGCSSYFNAITVWSGQAGPGTRTSSNWGRDDMYARWEYQCSEGGWVYGNASFGSYPGDLTVNSSCQIDGGVTNGYAVYNVAWTNDGPTWAWFDVALMGSNGVIYTPEGFSSIAVGPGKSISPFSITNFGMGGQLLWGDNRPGATSTDGSSWGTWVGANSGASGSGSTSVGPPGVVNPNVSGIGITNTGSATGGDLNRVGATIVSSGAAVERAVRDLADALGAGTNGIGNGSNIVAAIDRNREATQTGLSNVWGSVELTRTNIGEIASNVWQMVENGRRASTNVGVLYTNLYDFVAGGTNLSSWASNSIADFGMKMTNAVITGNALNAAGDAAVAWMGSSPAAPSDWGVLKPTINGKEIFRMDVKESLALSSLEEKVSGFRAWFKLIILWGILIWVFCSYMWELRQSIWHALTPTPVTAGVGPFSNLLTFGGGAPLLLGQGAHIIWKSGAVLAIVSALLFLPGIIVASITTLQLMLGLNQDWVQSQAGILGIFNVPVAIKYTVTSILTWFPFFEIVVIGINYAACMLGLDGTTAILMVYVKVATPE